MPEFVRVNFNNMEIDRGKVTLSMRGFFNERAFFGSGVTVKNATLLLLMAEGQASDGAVDVPGIEVLQGGHLKVSDRLRPHMRLEGAAEDVEDELFDPDPREPGWV